MSKIPADIKKTAQAVISRMECYGTDFTTVRGSARDVALVANAILAERQKWAEPEVKIMPRGGVERDWWTEYQLLLRQFKKLAKVARQCVEEVDANLAKDDWPVKYRAPFGALIKLREALPETYDEFKARNADASAILSPAEKETE